MSEFVVRNGLIVSGSTYLEAISQSNQAYILSYDSVTNEVAYMPTSSVVVTVPGSDTQVIFNNGGVFGASSNLVFSGSRVGIGTTSPTARLEIDNVGGGSAMLNLSGNDQANVRLRFTNSGAGGRNYEIIGGLAGVNNSNFSIFDVTATTTRLTIDSGGNVGIGTTNPLYRLDVQGSAGNIARITDGTSHFLFYAGSGLNEISTTGPLLLTVSGSERMRITTAGSIGIGTTSPGSRLTVAGEGSGSVRMGNTGFGGDWVGISLSGNLNTTDYNLLSSATNTSFYLNRPSGGDILFRHNNVDQMIIKSGGNVGIGTTNPQAKLEVSGSIALGGTSGRIYYPRRIVLNSAGDFAINNNADSENLLYVDTTKVWVSGSLGIGTSSPAAKLDIAYSTNPTTATPHIILTTGGTSKQAAITAESFNVGGLVFSTGDGTLVDRMTILRTNGNVGIGLTNPSHKLAVLGAVSASSFTGSFSGSVSAPGATTQVAFNSGGTLSADSGLVYSGSRVGIGLATPGAKLDIVSTVDGSEGLRVDGAGGGFAFVVRGGTTYTTHIRAGATIGANYFSTPPTNGLIVEGNVGIGTTAPAVAFEISGSTNLTTRIRVSKTAAGRIEIGADRDTFNSPYISTLSNSNLDFFTNDTHRIRIASDGNVGIGTNSIDARLTIQGSLSAAAEAMENILTLRRGFNSGIAFEAAAALALGRNLGDTQTRLNFVLDDSNGNTFVYDKTVLSLLSGGNVGIGTTNPSHKLSVLGAVSASSFTGSFSGIATNAVSASFAATASSADAFYVRGSVGIGTASPGRQLELAGAADAYIQLTRNNTGVQATLGFNTGVTNDWLIRTDDVDSNLKFYSYGTSGYALILARSTGAATFSSSVTATSLIFKDAINSNSYGFRGLSGIITLDAGSVYPTGWNFQFGGGSSSALYISGSGNVGIGTTNPTAKLQVDGDIITGNASTLKSVSGFLLVQGATNLVLDGATGTVNIRTNSTDKLVVTNAGNVGIGITNPTSRLHVSGGNGYIDGDLTVTGAITAQELYVQYISSSIIYSTGSNKFGDQTSDNQFFTGSILQSGSLAYFSGNVGIGTTSPNAKLQVELSGTVSLAAATIVKSTDFGASSRAGFSGLADNSDGIYFGMGANGTGIPAGFGFFREASGWNTALTFYTNNITAGPDSTAAMQEKMRITSAGNVGIGTASPTHKLQVSGSIALNTATDGSSRYFTYPDANHSWYYDDNIVGSSADVMTYYENFLIRHQDTTNVFLINGSGNVGIGTTAPTNKLQVAGGVTATSFTGSFSGSVSAPGSTTQVVFNSGGALAASSDLVFSGSNVGIGTTSPVNRIQANYSPVAINSLTATAGTAATNWNRNAGVLISGASISNAIAIGVSGTANDRKAWIQSGHPDSAAESLGIISLNPLGGNVGIGTTSPASKLEVAGGIASTFGSTNGYVALQAGGATVQGYIEWFKPGPTRVAYMGYNDGSTANNLAITLENSANFIINNGNVGIGITAPLAPLDVNGNVYIRATGALFTNTIGGFTTNLVSIGASTNFTVPTGNVGIGTTNPNSGSLQIYRAADTNHLVLNGGSAYTNVYAGNFLGSLYLSTNYYYSSGHVSDNASLRSMEMNMTTDQVYFSTMPAGSPGTRTFLMTISGSQGFIGIGTTSPSDELTVNSAGNSTGIAIQRSGTTKGLLEIGSSTDTFSISATSATGLLSLSTNSAERMRITSGGFVGIGLTTPVTNLHINGVCGPGSSGALSLAAPATGGGCPSYIIMGNNDSAGVAGPTIISSANRSLSFGVGDSFSSSTGGNFTGSMSVTGNGDVGIGTNAPATKLNLKESNSGTEGFIITNWNSVNTVLLGSDSATGGGKLTLKTNGGASNVFISSYGDSYFSGGNVGIGTTNPGYKLEVKGAGTAGGILAGFVGTGPSGSISISHSGNGGAIGYANVGATSNLFYVTTGAGTIGSGFVMDNNGNVGIGTTSPDTKLHVWNGDSGGAPYEASGITIENSGRANLNFLSGAGNDAYVFFGNSSAGNAGYVGYENTANRLVLRSSDSVSLLDSTGEVVRIDGGNVGIGTTGPLSPLHQVAGGGDYTGEARFGGSSTAFGIELKYNQAGSTSGSIYVSPTYSSADVLFKLGAGSGNANQLVLKGNGNVGIGTTAPANTLQIGSVGATGYSGNKLAVGDGTNVVVLHPGAVSYLTANGDIVVGAGGNATNQLYVKSGGNVGIGTNAPSATLDVLGASLAIRGSQTRLSILTNYPGSGDIPAGTLISVDNVTNNNLGIIPSSAGTVGSTVVGVAYNGSAWRSMYEYANVNTGEPNLILVKTAGNVGIGTTNPGYKLDVSGSGRFTGGLSLTSENPQLTFTDTTAGEDDMVLSMNGDYLEFLSNALRNIITIQGETSAYAGNVGIGTGSPSQKLSIYGDIAIANSASIQETRIGKYQSGSLGSGTHTIASISVTSVDAVFFDYVIKNSTTDLRAGTVMAVTNGSTVEYTDISTADIGDTSKVTMISDVSGGNIRLRASIDTGAGSWTVRTLLRTI